MSKIVWDNLKDISIAIPNTVAPYKILRKYITVFVWNFWVTVIHVHIKQCHRVLSVSRSRVWNNFSTPSTKLYQFYINVVSEKKLWNLRRRIQDYGMLRRQNDLDTTQRWKDNIQISLFRLLQDQAGPVGKIINKYENFRKLRSSLLQLWRN